MAKEPSTRVIVVGGGFGGLNAAHELGSRGRHDVDVLVIDRRNHHVFQPLLYQVAMAGLSPADISTPIRSELRRHSNVQVRLGQVTGVDLRNREVELGSESLPYNYLVLACGASDNYFGNNDWKTRAPGLKTLEQATEIRRRVLSAFERAEIEPSVEKRRALLTFVVVGGGPTGVELAGALGELSRYTLSRDFRRIRPSSTRVILIEGGARILPAFAPDLADAAARSLENLGVTIWTDIRVSDIDDNGVRAGTEYVQAATVLWAAGTRANALNEQLGLPTDRLGRVSVERDLSLPGHPEVFVVGDQAHWEHDGIKVPPLAPGAIQQGRAAARNILADLRGTPRVPFHYVDKGIMATIGRAKAVVQSGRLNMHGFVAWVAWCFVHILYLIGFRNRFLVFSQWVWSYFRFKRGARLITRQDWRNT